MDMRVLKARVAGWQIDKANDRQSRGLRRVGARAVLPCNLDRLTAMQDRQVAAEQAALRRQQQPTFAERCAMAADRRGAVLPPAGAYWREMESRRMAAVWRDLQHDMYFHAPPIATQPPPAMVQGTGHPPQSRKHSRPGY